jgi:hypothetical protein
MSTVNHDQTIEWMESDHGIHQPFPVLDADHDEVLEPRSVMEFNATGFVVKGFLKDGGDYGHSLTLKLEDDVLTRVKAIISTSPRFQVTPSYHSPFKDDNTVTFANREKKAGAFEFIWDGRSIHDFDDVDLRHPISHTTIRNGSKVYVEYTAEAWSYEKKGKERVDRCRLTLLSIGLLESPHSNCDFDSARKKRRMAY